MRLRDVVRLIFALIFLPGALANLILAIPLIWLLRYEYPDSTPALIKGIRYERSAPGTTSG